MLWYPSHCSHCLFMRTLRSKSTHSGVEWWISGRRFFQLSSVTLQALSLAILDCSSANLWPVSRVLVECLVHCANYPAGRRYMNPTDLFSSLLVLTRDVVALTWLGSIFGFGFCSSLFFTRDQPECYLDESTNRCTEEERIYQRQQISCLSHVTILGR